MDDIGYTYYRHSTNYTGAKSSLNEYYNIWKQSNPNIFDKKDLCEQNGNDGMCKSCYTDESFGEEEILKVKTNSNNTGCHTK